MVPEENLLLSTARQNFQQSRVQECMQLCTMDTFEWDHFYRLAKVHGVAALVFHNLSSSPELSQHVPSTSVQRFRSATLANSCTKMTMHNRLREALEFLADRQIDVMLLKGIALDVVVYRQPWYVEHADIDLLLRPRSPLTEEEAREIWAINRDRTFESELHQHHDLSINGMLPIDYEGIWAKAVTTRFLDSEVYVMSPEYLLIAASINSCRKRYLRLKGICGVAEILDHFGDFDWDKAICHARQSNCEAILYTALRVAHRKLGSDFPQRPLEELRIGRVRRRLIDREIERMSFSDPLGYSSWNAFVRRKFHRSALLPWLSYRMSQRHARVWTLLRTRFALAHKRVTSRAAASGKDPS